eukprot:10936300-Lingulodinium_polyedra.AAC.1
MAEERVLPGKSPTGATVSSAPLSKTASMQRRRRPSAPARTAQRRGSLPPPLSRHSGANAGAGCTASNCTHLLRRRRGPRN